MSQRRRVRHELADAVLLMGFSAGVATALAVGLALVSRLA